MTNQPTASPLIDRVPDFTAYPALVRPPFDFQQFTWSDPYAEEVYAHGLIIESFKSTCTNCGQAALPYEGSHYTRPSGDPLGAGPGCGNAWLVAFTEDESSILRAFIADLGLIDAGVITDDYDPRDIRGTVRLRPAIRV